MKIPPLVNLDNERLMAYVAGIVDGEGTVHIMEAWGARSLSPSHHVQVTITNTSTDLMEWLVSNLGGRIEIRRDPGRPAHHKQPYSWRVHGMNAENLLRAIQPWVVIKARQVDCALRLRALIGVKGQRLTPELVAARQALKDEMHLLNRRGPAEEAV